MDDVSYLGYVLWTDGKTPVLRQWFIVPERRSQGIGTTLLAYWADSFAFTVAPSFGVESPNDITRAVLVKHGYARRTETGIEDVRCYFVSGM